MSMMSIFKPLMNVLGLLMQPTEESILGDLHISKTYQDIESFFKKTPQAQ